MSSEVKVKVTQSCLTLCDPMIHTVHGILEARILEWLAFSFSRGFSQSRDWTQVSCIVNRFFPSWAMREAQMWLWAQEVSRQPVCWCSSVVWPEVFPALDPTDCWMGPGLDAKISASGRAHTDECALIHLPCLCAQSCSALLPHELQPSRLLCPWTFSGKTNGVCYHFLLQGIFPTQGSNLGFLHCRQILYCLSHQGLYDSPKISTIMLLWYQCNGSHPLYWTFQFKFLSSGFLLQNHLAHHGSDAHLLINWGWKKV